MSSAAQTAHNTEFVNSANTASIVLTNRLALDTLNACFTAVGAATATTTSKAKTVNTATYTIDGVFKTKAGTDNLWTLTGGTVPVASFTKYLLLLDASGVATVLQSSVATAAASCVYASMPDAVCVVAVLQIATDATHTFIPGTTLLGATGITATFTDGTDKLLLPLVADASTGAQILALSGGANAGSLLG